MNAAPHLLIACATTAALASIASADTALERRARPGDWLEVSNFSGAISITGSDGDMVRIFAEHGGDEEILAVRRGKRLRIVSSAWDEVADDFRVAGDDIRIRLDRSSGQPAPIAYRIEAPAWMPVRAVGPLTSVTIEGMRHGAEVVVVRGDVTLRDAAGRFEITARRGQLTLEGVTGRAEITAAECDVIARRTAADLFVETTTGSIRFLDLTAARARATSVLGTVEWRGAIPPLGHVSLATHSGAIELALPEDAGVDLDLRTFRGRLETPMAIELPPPSAGSRRLRHTLGGGGGRLTIETFDGAVRLGYDRR